MELNPDLDDIWIGGRPGPTKYRQSVALKTIRGQVARVIEGSQSQMEKKKEGEKEQEEGEEEGEEVEEEEKEEAKDE